MTTLKLQEAYLCPGQGEGAHVTDSAVMCNCGNRNLVPLAAILDRQDNPGAVIAAQRSYDGIGIDSSPTLRILFAEGEA